MLFLIQGCVKERTDNIHYYDNVLYGGVDVTKGLTINEICNHGCTYPDLLNPSNPDHWIEIYNVSNSSIALSDPNVYYYLSGTPIASGSPGSSLNSAYRLNTFTIPSHAALVVFVDDSNKTDSKDMHSNIHLSKHGGDFIGLYTRVMPIDTVRVLTTHYNDTISSGKTFGAYYNGSDHWQIYTGGTPGQPNPHP
jgi:hypothetical protein